MTVQGEGGDWGSDLATTATCVPYLGAPCRRTMPIWGEFVANCISWQVAFMQAQDAAFLQRSIGLVHAECGQLVPIQIAEIGGMEHHAIFIRFTAWAGRTFIAATLFQRDIINTLHLFRPARL